MTVSQSSARAEGDLDTLSAYRLADRSHVSTLTRAHVIGDVQMYRESGLAALDGGEATDFTTTHYAAAQGRYAQLRLSLEVAALERQSAGHEASGSAK